MASPQTPASAAPGADDPRPLPPTEPQLEDCCGSGCVVCVFDAYEMARERHAARLAAWELRHATPATPTPTPPARESSP